MAWNDYIGLDSDETFNVNVSIPNLNSTSKSNISEETKSIDLSSYAKKTDIPDVTNLATKVNVTNEIDILKSKNVTQDTAIEENSKSISELVTKVNSEVKTLTEKDSFLEKTIIDSHKYINEANVIAVTARDKASVAMQNIAGIMPFLENLMNKVDKVETDISKTNTKVDTNKTEATQTIETLKTKDTAMETNISSINTTLNSKANLVNGKVPKNEVYNQFQDLGYHSINFDTFKEPGVFHINYTACTGNTKPQGIENGLLITHKYNDTWVIQEYVTWGNRIFRRTTRDNVWTSWREI